MAVRMKVDWNDGRVFASPGDVVTEFSAAMESRLVRAGLAEAQSLNDARGRVGMPPLSELAQLREQYRAVLGRSAYHGWDADQLRQRIEEAAGS